ncbi:MAG: DUF481 domain-containing protein [Cellvibrionales bacterium TMED148]|nr:MAG: DUF481 domain-containing protein [Cellvibrionales bacterium TMED148]
MRYRFLLLLPLLLMRESNHANQIRLKNGDLLNGKLIDVTESKIVWRSDTFGLLSIPIDDVVKTLDGRSFQKLASAVDTDSFEKSLASYEGNVSISGSASSGNQERKNWDFDVTLERTKDQLRQIGTFEYESHSLDGRQAENSFNVIYMADWFIEEHWFWRNEVSVSADENRSLDQVFSVGSALGRQFWDDGSGALSTELGVLWVAENQTNDIKNEQMTLNWSLDYSKMFWNEITFYHQHDLWISMQDINDNQAEIDIGIKIPLIRDLFTEIKFEWIFDNKPVLGSDKLDSKYSIGINYVW